MYIEFLSFYISSICFPISGVLFIYVTYLVCLSVSSLSVVFRRRSFTNFSFVCFHWISLVILFSILRCSWLWLLLYISLFELFILIIFPHINSLLYLTYLLLKDLIGRCSQCNQDSFRGKICHIIKIQPTFNETLALSKVPYEYGYEKRVWIIWRFEMFNLDIIFIADHGSMILSNTFIMRNKKGAMNNNWRSWILYVWLSIPYVKQTEMLWLDSPFRILWWSGWVSGEFCWIIFDEVKLQFLGVWKWE